MNSSTFIQKYEQVLRVKQYAPTTVKNYVCQVEIFLNYFKLKDSPKHISSDEVEKYLLTAKCINSQRHAHSALKLFYKLTVHQPLKFKYIPYAKKEKKLPVVIDSNHILEALSKIENLKHKTLLSLAFSVGLRVSEIVNLRIEDIDSKRMIIHIKNAKGRKDRLVPLSLKVLELLRNYWQQYKPKEFLFNGQFSLQYSVRSCQQIFKLYIDKTGHFHQLRHSCFTNLLENGTDIRMIQKIAGHSSTKTTEIYTHVSQASLSRVNLPI
jgi:site-specific recombinase XerD